jgi:uncharacterized protein YigA (DUF484 family)
MTRQQSDASPERAGGKPASRGKVSPSAAEVADYLRRYPDFLIENPDLLEVLAPAPLDRGEGVVDLQRFLVERLRQQVAELRRAHDELLAVGRANMMAEARVHRAVLALLSANSFEHLIEIVTTDLAVILDLDVVALGVEQATDELPPVRLGGLVQLQPGAVDELIGRSRSIAFGGPPEGSDKVFGGASTLVKSHVLLRLSISQKTPPALLALGSRRGEMFRRNQRTELLSFMSRALERCIRAWLDLLD